MDVGGEYIESDAPPQCIGRAVLRKRLDKYQQRADGIVAGEQRRKDLPQPQAKDRPWLANCRVRVITKCFMPLPPAFS